MKIDGIEIDVKQTKSGLLIASSPDMPGLHAMERTEDELVASLREVIPLLREANASSNL